MTQAATTATLLEVIARRARAIPDRPAFSFDGEECSWRRLQDLVDRVAHGLVRRGLEAGDRVVVALPNGVEFLAAFFGAQRARMVAVPIFERSGADRIESIRRRCGAGMVLGEEDAAGGDERRLGARGLSIPALLESGRSPAGRLPEVRSEDLAYLQYTSGSTGEPKGVRITHAGLLTNIRQMIAGFGIDSDEIFVSWLPLYHDMGLVLMALMPLYVGARLVLLPTYLGRGSRWLGAIESHRATFTAAPDFAYRLCLRYTRDPDRFDLSSLRIALNAAEPVRSATLADLARTFGLQGALVPAYGLAEATAGVTAWQAGLSPRVDDRGFVSVGRPFPGVEVAILDRGEICPPGRTGEILVRGPGNTHGYFDDPAATRRLLREDGYLHTGDLGYLDQDGCLYVVGREKNIIIHAGRNLAPQEVEEVIERMKPVRRAAAVGIDRGGPEGEQLYVFTEPRGARAGDRRACRDLVIEIVDRIHGQLGLRPARAYLLRPRSIPMTPNGKVRHAELKRRHTSGELRHRGRILFPEY